MILAQRKWCALRFNEYETSQDHEYHVKLKLPARHELITVAMLYIGSDARNKVFVSFSMCCTASILCATA